MPYVGKTPTVGNFVKLDSITTSATATYNLLNGGVAYSPQSANHCIVSLNGVIQSPNTSFTISGSTIVFASALTSSDVIDFILVLGDVLNIGTPSDNTVSLAKLTATGTKNSTTFLRGDNTFASAGETNTPSFSAYRNSTQSSISNETYTKVQIDTEDFDTDNAYDNSTNYRFTIPSGEGGKYYFTWQVNGQAGDNNLARIHTVLYKNGSALSYGNNEDTTSGAASFNHQTHSASAIVDASAGDYFEVYVKLWVNSGTGSVLGHSTEEKVTRFEGFKVHN